MHRKYLYLSLLSLSIAACSSVSNKQANGGFEYAKKDEVTPITIPDSLLKPKQQPEFTIPVVETKGPVGENMDIRAPSLVLPIAAATRVEGNEGEAKVWFDQVLDDKDLLDFIRSTIKEEAKEDNVDLIAVNVDDTIFDSTWYSSQKESGVIFKEINETEKVRFRYSLGMKPHGRSVSVEVDAIEYMKEDESGTTTEMNPIDKHRAEMAMLNLIIGEVDYKYREIKRENILMKANKNIVSLGTNSDNEPAFIVDMEIDSLWSNIPSFFTEYGFTTTDLNESKNLYFVDFVKPGTGFWDNIWGDDKPQLDLVDGKYRFDLDKVEEQTSVTLLDTDGSPLPLEILEKLLPVMENGLSFKTVL